MPMLKLGSKWFKPEDTKTGECLKFIDEGVELKKMFGKEEKTVFEITIELNGGDQKVWTMNKTSQNSIGAKHGKDTKNWVNTLAEISILSQNVGGIIRDVIYCKPM